MTVITWVQRVWRTVGSGEMFRNSILPRSQAVSRIGVMPLASIQEQTASRMVDIIILK